MKGLLVAAWGFAAAILLGAGPALSAAPTMREVLTALYAVHDLGAVDLSPTGAAVVWQESFHSAQHLLDSPRMNALYLQRLAGGAPLRITAGATDAYYDEEDPVWSPNGSAIAFLSDARSKGRPQLCVADADAAHVRQIGKLNGNVARLTWSPDGKTLAVLYIASAHRKTGAFAPGARDVGVIGTIVDEQRLADDRRCDRCDAFAHARRLVRLRIRLVSRRPRNCADVRKRKWRQQLVGRAAGAGRRRNRDDARPALRRLFS